MMPLTEIEKAIAFDSTLTFSKQSRGHLVAKYIQPQTYSRKKLYDNMFAGKTVVFTNYPLTLVKDFNESSTDTLIRMLKAGLPQKRNDPHQKHWG